MTQAQTAARFDLAGLIDASPATISIIDPKKWKVVFQNQAGERLVGDAVGERCYQAFGKEDGPCEFCRANDALQTGQATSAEVQMPSGEWRLLQWSPVKDERGRWHAVETITDITETKSREEEYRRLKDEYEQIAVTEPLTGLLNRRGWWNLAERHVRRACVDGSGLRLLLIDVDHFRQINDRFGHAVGDEVLRQVARRLVESLRPTDLIGRWGGEEFIVLLSPAADNVVSLAERLRHSISRMSGFIEEAPEVSVTVTIGCYSVSAASEPVIGLLDSAITHADRCLYDGKRAGRNCTKVYAESCANR